MGIEKLSAWAIALAIAAASTGQLPKILAAVRVAQLELIRDSQASKWQKAPLLPMSR